MIGKDRLTHVIDVNSIRRLTPENQVVVGKPQSPVDANSAQSLGMFASLLYGLMNQASIADASLASDGLNVSANQTPASTVESQNVSTKKTDLNLQPSTLEWMVLSLMQDLPIPGQVEASDTGTVAEDGLSDTSLLANGYGDGSQNTDALLSILAVLQSQAGANPFPLMSDTSTVWPSRLVGMVAPAMDPTVQNDAVAQSGEHTTVPDIQAIIQSASQKYGVPASLIRAVIEQESGMNPYAESSAGALGLMQLMPETARSLGIKDPLNPAENIDGGTKYLAQLLQQFGGNTALALAAYNAGPGAVQAYGGIPPFPETEQYVSRVLQLSTQFESSGL
jgi:hypothetical protein